MGLHLELFLFYSWNIRGLCRNILKGLDSLLVSTFIFPRNAVALFEIRLVYLSWWSFTLRKSLEQRNRISSVNIGHKTFDWQHFELILTLLSTLLDYNLCITLISHSKRTLQLSQFLTETYFSLTESDLFFFSSFSIIHSPFWLQTFR